MKQIKMTQYEAAMILVVLKEADRLETFKNGPSGALFQYENINRNMILSLEQLLQLSQNKKTKKVA
jgi:hypothetical protein